MKSKLLFVLASDLSYVCDNEGFGFIPCPTPGIFLSGISIDLLSFGKDLYV